MASCPCVDLALVEGCRHDPYDLSTIKKPVRMFNEVRRIPLALQVPFPPLPVGTVIQVIEMRNISPAATKRHVVAFLRPIASRYEVDIEVHSTAEQGTWIIHVSKEKHRSAALICELRRASRRFHWLRDDPTILIDRDAPPTRIFKLANASLTCRFAQTEPMEFLLREC
jgi:hypothetical protein